MLNDKKWAHVSFRWRKARIFINKKMDKLFYTIILGLLMALSAGAQQPKIRIQDGEFIDSNNDCFIPFGYNYGGTGYPLLLEDNWLTDTAWALMAGDFQEMKDLN